MMPTAVQNDERTSVNRIQGVAIEHSISGYLEWCQDQLPNLDIEYTISGRENSIMPDDIKWGCMAQGWKQCTQEFRRTTRENAAKNEPHPGEPGQGGYGSHPRLTPYETEKVLEALLNDDLEWNMDENDDYDEINWTEIGLRRRGG